MGVGRKCCCTPNAHPYIHERHPFQEIFQVCFPGTFSNSLRLIRPSLSASILRGEWRVGGSYPAVLRIMDVGIFGSKLFVLDPFKHGRVTCIYQYPNMVPQMVLHLFLCVLQFFRFHCAQSCAPPACAHEQRKGPFLGAAKAPEATRVSNWCLFAAILQRIRTAKEKTSCWWSMCYGLYSKWLFVKQTHCSSRDPCP